MLDWAERLRSEGHVVHVPDLCEGRTFDDYASGLQAMEEMGGVPGLMERTLQAVRDLPSDVIYAGFSNGGGCAQWLGMTRPGARGVALMHAALPPVALGADAWPTGLPVQVHYAEADPFRDNDAVAALESAACAAGAPFEMWDYPGSGHLFADPDLPDFDPISARRMFDRLLAFLTQH